MEIYTSTYNYVRNKNKELCGDYYINFEDTLTDNLTEKKIKWKYTKIPYKLDANRRIFDIVWNDCGDTRKVNLNYSLAPIDINIVEDTSYIKVIPLL